MRLPVHPLTRATYREALTPSRAQDDPPDAALQVASLLTHRDTLTPLVPHSPTMRALAPLVAHRRRVVGATGRLTHRLTSALTHSFPHVLQWFPDKATGRWCDFLRRWPTLTAAPRARRTTLETVCRAPHGRAADGIASRIQAIQSALALTTDDGVIPPNLLLVPARIAQRRVTWQAIAAFDTASAPRAQAPPAFPWCDAWPGAGAVCAPRLRVACGAQRERCTAAADLHKEAGMAPGTARRGTQSWVHWRLQCPTCLRHTCVAGAADSTRHAFWAQVSSQQQREQGKAHQAAVRA